MNTLPFGVKAGWWAFELPHYRLHPKRSTYSLFSYGDLPPIIEKLDDQFNWLKSQSIKKRSLIDGRRSDGSKPDLSKITSIASQFGILLPESFTTFLNSENLHKRIRSCTDCYLDLADKAVETKGNIAGYLVHFLSDSQLVGHWYIYMDHHGSHFVVCSLKAYGFAADDDGGIVDVNKIDIQEDDVWFCAPSFTDFIYRFWLENEIWYALMLDKRPLTETEQVYVDKYSGEAK